MARRGRPARKAGRDAGFATGSALSICNDMAVIQVPHQHAHASAVAGEFAHELRWLCFTWDSVGPGDAGARRGGETLLGRPGDWSLIATFRPFAPPGGDAAAGQPWRSAAALAWELGLDWTPADLDTGLCARGLGNACELPGNIVRRTAVRGCLRLAGVGSACLPGERGIDGG